jgi:hypothetical protein
MKGILNMMSLKGTCIDIIRVNGSKFHDLLIGIK